MSLFALPRGVAHQTFDLGAEGSSPSGLTNEINVFRLRALAAPQGYPRPSPETAPRRARCPRGTDAPWATRGDAAAPKKRGGKSAAHTLARATACSLRHRAVASAQPPRWDV